MPSTRISKELNSRVYFLTFTVKNWYYIFDRHNRFEILGDSISYCRRHKGLRLYAYVFMINHIHLIASAPDMAAFVRDFKRHTSSEISKNIIATEPDLLRLFQTDEKWEFWQKTNMPKIIESEDYFSQKVNYIHNNPVKKQYVQNPEHWLWSSANPESTIKIDNIES